MYFRLNATLKAISDLSAYVDYPFTWLFPFDRPSSNWQSKGYTVCCHCNCPRKGSQT